MSVKQLRILAWSLSGLVAVLAFIAWGQGQAWQFSHLSTYTFFPLFGLLAFSLMWSHYAVSVIRQILKIDRSALHTYFEVTSLGVLIALLLHPGLLEYQLWRDGFGLPPNSFLHHYVARGLGWVALIGFVSWFVFLAYELRRVFSGKPWWPYLTYLVDIAMLGIFYHALRLGTQIHGWFRVVWWFYGLTLVAALMYIYTKKYQARQLQPVESPSRPTKPAARR